MDFKQQAFRPRTDSTCSSDSYSSDVITEAIGKDFRIDSDTASEKPFQPLPRDVDWQELLMDGRRALKLVLHNQLEKGIELCERQKHRSFMHATFLAQIKMLQATNLEKAALEEAHEAYKYVIAYTNAIRRRPWANVLGLTNISFLRPNYNKYSDEEVLAELIYGMAMGPMGMLNFFLKGKTSMALLSSSWYGNRCYRSYWEVENIFTHRTEWDHPLIRRNLEGTIKMMRGGMALGMARAPQIAKKFMKMFGYINSESSGVEDIYEAARMTDCSVYPVAVITILVRNAVIEPFYGGERPNFENLDQVVACFDEEIYGSMHKLVWGAIETMRGNIEQSIEAQREAFPSLRCLGKSYLICYVINMINYMLLCDWENSLKFLNTSKKERKLTKLYSSGVNYLHACLLMMIREDKEARGVSDKELDETIMASLREATVFRGIFLLKRIKELFIIPMVVDRAKRYVGDLDSFASPLFEILYFLNAFNVLDAKPHLLAPFFDRILVRLTTVSNREESESQTNCLAYYLFFKGVLLKHLGRLDEALETFNEVMSLEDKLTYYEELIVHTRYEIGLVHRNKGNFSEAARWLERAGESKDYYTHELMRYRIAKALESVEPEQLERAKAEK